MRSRGPLVASCAVLSCAVLGASPARADDVADAKDLFARGRDMRERGNCAGAVDLFRKAVELYPAGLGSVRNLAECEEQLGHFASSRRAWLDLRRALVTIEDHKYDGWSKDADAAVARLAPKVATLTVDLNAVDRGGATAPSHKGIDVYLDGAPLAATLVGTALERDPGQHVVKVSGARVTEPQEQAVVLTAGDSRRVSVRVVVAPDPSEIEPVAAAANSPAPAPSADDPGHGRRVFGWVVLGAGVASLGGAAVAFAVRQSSLDSLSSQCPSDSSCAPSLQSTVSRGQTASALFTVLGLVGGVAVVGGGALVLTAPSSSPPPSAGLLISPTLGGASARWSF